MRRPVLVILAITAAAVVLVFVAAAIAVFTVDPNTLVAPVRERVKATTGRDLAIKGGVSLKLSLEPELEIRDVTLGNAPWASGPTLIAARRLEVRLALLPLLKRQLDVRHIALIEPRISLETDANGRGNWELARTERAGTSASSAAPTATASALVGIGDVHIENGALDYRNGRTGNMVRIAIERLDLHARDLHAPVNATFRGSVDGIAVALTGNAGPLAALLERGEAEPVRVEGEIAARKVKAQGKVRIETAATTIDDFHATLGSSEVSGSVAFRDQNGRSTLVLRLTAPRLAFADLALPVAGAAAPAGAPAPAPTAAPVRPDFVLSDAPLPLAAIAGNDMDVDLAAGALLLGNGKRMDDVHVRATASAGRLDASELGFGTYGGRVRAAVHADTRTAPPRVRIEVAADDIDLGLALAEAGSRAITGGRTQIRADIATQGASLHQWAAAATGQLNATVAHASLQAAQRAKSGGIVDLLTAVLPSAGVGDITELRCAVVRLPLRGGVARIERSIGIETNRVGLVATGTIDFANERLDLGFKPVGTGGGAINVAQLLGLVHWRGPWRDPRIALNPTGTIENVGRLGSLFAPGGLSALRGVLPTPPRPAAEPGACTIARGSS